MGYQTTTLSELQTALIDRTDGSVYWEREESRLAWNETLALWNLLTGRWRTTATQNLVLNQTTYTVPAALLTGCRVQTLGQPLYLASRTELDLTDPLWRTRRTSDGGTIPSRPLYWAPISLTQIALSPTPAATVMSGLTIEGIAATPVLVGEGDFLDLADEDRNPLENFVLHTLAFKEGGPRWRATADAVQELLQFAAEINGVLKRSQTLRRMAGLDRRRDLQPSRQAPNRIPLLQRDLQIPGGDAGGGGRS